MTSKSLRRLAAIITADLNPPLGTDPGPCSVLDRAQVEIKSPRLLKPIIETINGGDELDRDQERLVYDEVLEKAPGNSRMHIVEHAAHRMDLRGITVEDIRASLGNFLNWYGMTKNKTPLLLKQVDRDLIEDGYKWVDKKKGLVVVFLRRNPLIYRIITVYSTTESEPDLPPGGCPLKGR